MKRKLLLLLVLSAFVLAGCESMGPKAETGAVTGGLVGATAGGIIGYQTGHPLIGAGIGAAAGALGGGLLGDSWDKQDKAALKTNPQYLPLTKIAEMGEQGVPDAVIINEIQRTKSVYKLNSAIVTYLQKHKVSNNVIDYMMGTSAK